MAAGPSFVGPRDSETFYLFLDGACTDVVDGNTWCGTSIGGALVFPDGSVLRALVRYFRMLG